ncbi:glycosyltransferase family 2 protein [Lactobacillus sp. YT155]|uniref:glycosyltransferase family 2 protein n=1 Tax=Lactobacillus sp. YT155 TaxID=3060955 RepID=UPI00265FF506|nr:glycosyltransferase family 2 protein [Lactobacillus sp. YT155]MDO1605236.1 glycosyltransferase family 2 protein [Lactobacillus sp. YT155]
MDTKVSVCMATYNGQKTITKQLNSILKQLSLEDEMIIVDDCSTDETIKTVKEITATFKGTVIIEKNAQNMGPIFSFEKALKKATGDLIFLSDQDDEWLDNKVELMKNAYLSQHADLIVSDATVIGKDGSIIDSSWNHYNNNSMNQSVMGNLMKNGYTGAMMAVSKKLVALSLPFPPKVEMHDQWLFLVAKKNKLKTFYIKQPLMNYVRHGGNVTGMSKRRKKDMVVGRFNMLIDYLKLRRTER